MRIGKTLPPAAAPLDITGILSGLSALFQGDRAVQRFEKELREHYQVPHAFLLSSGKAALTVILLALKELFPGKDEVLISAYTCYSVPAAIVKAGLKVRLCDIDPETLDFDWNCIEGQLQSKKLLCVVSTHLFGLPADTERLKQLTASRGLPVVEDAAQAMGGEVEGKKIGTLGHVALFSLGRGKALSTVSGGVIITSDPQLGAAIGKVVQGLPGEGIGAGIGALCYAVALLLLIHPLLYWIPKALPFLKLGETVFDPCFDIRRLGAFQAGLSVGWQAKLARLRRSRLGNAEALISAGLGRKHPKLESSNIIKLPVLVSDQQARSRILEKSERLGLGVSTVYPEAVYGIPELRGSLLGKPCPQAEAVAKRILSLPVHPFVTLRDVDQLARLFNQ